MKRPYTKHHSLFFIVPLLIVIFFVFALLPQAKPTAAEQPGSGVCVRFSLNQGHNAASGAGVNGRYDMREVTTGAILASWEADSQATVSDWITDLPQVSDDGSWVEVNFYPAGEGTAVSLQILNPAPNTPYGWVANGQCHAIELQFAETWSSTTMSSGNKEIGLGGGENVVTTEETDTKDNSQAWGSNLSEIRPIINTNFSNVPSFLEVENLGSWVNQEAFIRAYGFTLTNPSPNHFLTDLTFRVNAYDANGTLLFYQDESVRDIYPSESANIGNSILLPSFVPSENGWNDADIDQIEIEFLTAERLEISDEPEPLLLLSPEREGFDPPPISIDQDTFVDENGTVQTVDLNSLTVAMEFFNPNGAFVASNPTVSIAALDASGVVLGQFQGGGGEIPPRQRWTLSGSIPLESPERVDHVEVNVDVEQYVPVDPTTLPKSVIQSVDISFQQHNISLVISPNDGLPFATQQILSFDEALWIAIARNEEGLPIGGGFYYSDIFPFEIFNSHLYIIPIQASEIPVHVDVYANIDYLDVPNRRGGGGNQIGRDDFPVELLGARQSD